MKRAQINKIKELCEANLRAFIALVAPYRLLGQLHVEVIDWWTRSEALSNQLLLLPRGHQKSWLAAARVVWELTKDPTTTVLYISATERLAIKQLKIVKNILTSRIYKKYWPNMVAEEEGKRDKWSETEISIDHPSRLEEGIRDASVLAVGLTANITGLHCDITVLDDVVVPANAYTRDGRDNVSDAYSQLSSIENPGGRQWVVGTRYHPKDIYNYLMEMKEDLVSEETGEFIGFRSAFEVFQREVEDEGTGFGEFVWPRQQRKDGKWFGFNAQTLAKNRSKYKNQSHYHAQYYNDPHDSDNAWIDIEDFQYYEKSQLKFFEGAWYFHDRRLAIFAAIDFAFSLNKRADYTAVAVIGIDSDRNVFVLDIDRFKTDKIIDYFESIRDLYLKWGFRVLRAEVTVAQQAIVRELKQQYLRQAGIMLRIDEYRPTRSMGSKEERLQAILQPKYSMKTMYHYKGGNCELLEEELRVKNPPHDDIMDALAAAVDVAVPPAYNRFRIRKDYKLDIHPRFGGVAH